MALGTVSIIGTRGYPSYYGGFETLVRRLAPFLVDQGWDVTVYSRPNAIKEDDQSRDRRVRTVVTKGLDSQSLSTLSYGFSSGFNSAVFKPDVALIMNVANGFWLPMLKSRSIPTVVNVDGIEWERDKWGAAAKRVFRTGAQFTARLADELVFDSHGIADYWKAKFGRNGTFIPYGGDLEYPKLEVPRFERGSYILMVARLVPENSIDLFLEAIPLLRDKKIVIVGSAGYGGEYDEKVKRLEEASDNVTWLGHVSDDRLLFSLWENCGAYFHGHSVGGTNPALVQAMACGAPTVARDTVFNREVLGESAVFSEPDPAAIAAALRVVTDDPDLQERFRVGVRARASAAYSWDSICSDYHKLLLQASGR